MKKYLRWVPRGKGTGVTGKKRKLFQYDAAFIHCYISILKALLDKILSKFSNLRSVWVQSL